ncbi:IS1182 family transposase [Salinibius halmophilus]|uniref:IS1182 family transposase n=1 Tax=Salinibius halmophilus TaxID=1853216 RepID=UPI000E66CFB6|nr:IS1182 family transposase [Salinibius halmophilus]
MPNFIPYDYGQNSMVVINYADQLQPGTFEHAVYYLVEHKLDMSVFESYYKNDDGGRAAYDPRVLLKIVLFAYSKGIRSSREIQWQCQHNIIFKALSCDAVPHFTTIAAFISERREQVISLFEQILLICDQQGLLGKELFAIDGCKMRSNAAKEWSGTHKELEQKRQKLQRLIHHHVIEHTKLDELEEDVAQEKRKKIESAVTKLDKAEKKVAEFLANNTPRMGKGKRSKEVKSNITDNESAKMTTSKGTIQGYNGVGTADKKHQIIVNATAFGEGQEHHTLIPILEDISETFQKLGIADTIFSDGTIVTADTGFANEANYKDLKAAGINAYVPDNKFRERDPKFAQQKQKHGKRKQDIKKRKTEIFPNTDFQFDPETMICICPAGEELTFRHKRPNEDGHVFAHFSGRMSQCKNCDLKAKCMHNPKSAEKRKGKGRQVAFMIERAESVLGWMQERVDSEQGKAIYGHRMSVIEPVFANLGTQKGLDRFSLRGRDKVDSQWKLFAIIHNIEKLYKYGNLVM